MFRGRPAGTSLTERRKWMAKALLQQVLSRVPRGEELNYLLQTKVTRSLPAGQEDFDLHVEQAVAHWRRYLQHDPVVAPQDACFYEFGTGWDAIVPVALWGLGVREQILVDIRRQLRPSLVNTTLATYAARRTDLAASFGVALRELPLSSIGTVEDLAELGIRYLAPCDARATGLPSGSVDMVTSTFTLEHVSPEDIVAILREARRLLAPTGLLGSAIDLQDHYSYFDSGVSVYGYLKYSERVWRLFNPDLHYQNRLRFPQYLELFEKAGMRVVDQEVQWPTAPELAELASAQISPQFRRFELEDLGVRSTYLTARPLNGRVRT